MMKINMIAAMTENRVIGIENRLPWRLKADLIHFKKMTLHQTILMGKNTFLSIGKPLPERRNIVLTQQHFDQVETIRSPKEIIKFEEDIMVIGGAQLYQLFLPYTETLYLTLVKTEIAGDAFFPHLNSQWELVFQEDHFSDADNQFDFSFLTYRNLAVKSLSDLPE